MIINISIIVDDSATCENVEWAARSAAASAGRSVVQQGHLSVDEERVLECSLPYVQTATIFRSE